MGFGYRLLSRPLLAVQDSEKAHARSILGLKIMVSNPFTRAPLRLVYSPQSLPVVRFGLSYRNPFGLAAGMDKKAEAIRGWEALGLGFIEIGGVTAEEQPGNPKPRMFRSGTSKALVNRMGFNNPGSKKIAAKLNAHIMRYGRPSVPLWANLGKSKNTPLEDAPLDYATTMERLWNHCDVFVINVSSPNTPGLRSLQQREPLKNLLASTIKARDEYASHAPLFVKLAPDLSVEDMVDVAHVVMETRIDGMIVSNTTNARPEALVSRHKHERGGLSGEPIKERSTECIRQMYKLTNGKVPIIGSGGVASGRDAYDKLKAGASCVEIYSSMVYEGPGVVSRIRKELVEIILENGHKSIDDIIGADQEDIYWDRRQERVRKRVKERGSDEKVIKM